MNLAEILLGHGATTAGAVAPIYAFERTNAHFDNGAQLHSGAFTNDRIHISMI